MPAGSGRMPVLFVGHGNPMNALEDNRWSRALRALAPALPRPRAVLAVSAHWYADGTFTTGSPWPPTVHDFGGFPEALYRVRYPAPGDPGLAARAAALAGGGPDPARGLDHGAWAVLLHLWPRADVPVVQLSLDARLTPAEHLARGRGLRPLRDEGVLLLASGNLVHNLGHALRAWRAGAEETPEWAAGFDAAVAAAVERHDPAALEAAAHGDAFRRAHPTPDHYLPLLYAAGAADPGEPVSFPVTGFDMGSLSMRTVRWGR